MRGGWGGEGAVWTMAVSRQVEVNVHAVEVEQKVDQGLFLVLRHMLEEGVVDSLVGG